MKNKLKLTLPDQNITVQFLPNTDTVTLVVHRKYPEGTDVVHIELTHADARKILNLLVSELASEETEQPVLKLKIDPRVYTLLSEKQMKEIAVRAIYSKVNGIL